MRPQIFQPKIPVEICYGDYEEDEGLLGDGGLILASIVYSRS